MNLQKFIYLTMDIDNHSIKLKIVSGFKGDAIKTSLGLAMKWDPLGNGKDKCFFLPGCNVPRFKVREHFTTTIKPSNATAMFVSSKTLEGSDNTFAHYRNTMEVKWAWIREWVRSLEETPHFFGIIENLINVDAGIPILLSETIWTTAYRLDDLNKTGISLQTTMNSQPDSDSMPNIYSYRSYAVQRGNQLYAYNKNNDLGAATASFYMEEAILEHLNVGNLVISNFKYEEFRQFGLAKDDENLILLMELMSNADYSRSVVNLTFLLKEFGENMVNLKECNHVNFKSMLTYLGLTPSAITSLSITRLTKVLKEHKVFTKSNVAKLSMLFAGEYINYADPDNTMWVEGLSLKKEEFDNLDTEIYDTNS